MALAAAALLFAATSCGTQRTDHAASRAQGDHATETKTPSPPPAEKLTAQNETHPKSSATRAPATTTEKHATHAAVAPAGPSNRVRLVQKGCVEFEPTWASVRMGQSLVWQSDLKSAITIHVTAGAFDRSEFLVRPGSIVSTGPARSPGTYSIWAEPTACQSAPHGVKGSGPGVVVDGIAMR